MCGLAYANASASFSVNVIPSGMPPTANFVANFNDVHQTIDGFGAADAFVEGIPSATIDSLYCINATDPGCSNPGIGLTLLRQSVGETDTQSNAAAVVARGGKVWETPWEISNPGDSSTYQASAQNIVNSVSALISAGIPIYAVATQNEPDCGCNGGSVWSASETAAFAAVLGPMVHSLSPSVKLISPEAAFSPDFPGFVSAIEADGIANAQTDIFSFHQYSSIPTTPNDGSRHVWETEMAGASTNDNSYDTSISDAANGVSEWVYDALVTYGVNAWHFWWAWYPDFSAGGNNQIYVDGNITKRYFAYGNWSRYVRPGWVRIGVSGSLSGLYGVAAFRNPSDGAFAIVAINNSGSDIQNVSFGVSGATVTGSVTPYVTSGTPIGALGSDGNLSAGSASSNVPASLPVSGGVFTSTVPYGVTTFLGQN
jgi:glucuronoarabinoxylan endo-1,4-beta-xylanase